jgi:hypothetical protein
MPALPLRAPSLALAGLVIVGAAALALAGRGIPTPWIMIDELLHAELARSLRDGDGYGVRGHGITVSWTYPALLAPFAWSYAAMKTVNAIVIACTAIPVFLWARRLVSPMSALAPAALTLLLPSMLFSSTLMLESLFLPLFVTACFVCALALERPTIARQAAALAAIGLAAATRVQGLLLLLVFVVAALLLRKIRALAPALVVCAAVSIAVVAKLSVGGLGVYEQHRFAQYSAGGIAVWLVRSAGELALAAGIVPLAALLALRARTERERVFVAVTAPATAALIGLAAVAAAWEPHGIKERYMAAALPLLLIALVVWVERGAQPRPWWAIALPAALAVALPLGRLFLEPSLLGNGWALLPFERAGLTAARILLAVGAVGAVALFLFAPRLAVVAVAAFLAASTAVVYSTIRKQSRTVLALSGLRDRDWIDDAGAPAVTYLNATVFEQETREGRWFEEWVPVWESEFWNRSALDVLTLGAPEPTPFFQRSGALDWSTGRVSGGSADYVLVDPRFPPAGRLIASSGRLALYRAARPLRLASATEGMHADGTTTGLAAFSSWTGRGTMVVETNGPAKLVAGAFAPLPGGGGRVAGTTLTRSLDGSTTFTAPNAPFRVEVRAAPGTHVTFGFMRA